MRQVEFIIVGQGISGTFLSWWLHRLGRSFVVIDDQDPGSASGVAAGIINPVTGRRIVKTWMIDELLPFALDAYKKLSRDLGIECIVRKDIVDFFPSAQMRQAFIGRYEDGNEYLSLPDDEQQWAAAFDYELGFGEIGPCYVVQLKELLSGWRQMLKRNDALVEAQFEEQKLLLRGDNLQYEDIIASKIIFCDGIRSAARSWFRDLPFALNKGEALEIKVEGLQGERIFKKGMMLVPMGGERFWVGSSYEWSFVDDRPGAAFRERTEALLRRWLKEPFGVTGHFAALRPATLERRPFVGMHPLHGAVGILNGMGTKGCSLAPYFAHQLAQHLSKGEAILPEADIARFRRILSGPSR